MWRLGINFYYSQSLQIPIFLFSIISNYLYPTTRECHATAARHSLFLYPLSSYKTKSMKPLKLCTALALSLLLCSSCTQQEPPTPVPKNRTPVQYRSTLFQSPCNDAQVQSCTNPSGNTQTFLSPKCASEADFLAVIGDEAAAPNLEYFHTFRMADAHNGSTYCQPQGLADFAQSTVICTEQCVDSTFDYWNTGTGDWTLYLLSPIPWQAGSLTIYGLDYPYTYSIEDFQNHGAPLPNGWWFEVRIHPKDWDKVLQGILFSAQRL